MTTKARADDFELSRLPDGFADDPFPTYDALLEHAPLKRFSDGTVMLSRHADLDRVYRDTTLFSSDKTVEFGEKYGAGTPLCRHHTTSLVFNDPPLHTRVRRLLSGALTPRAIAAMEPGLVALVDDLLDRMENRADVIPEFASAIPVEVIGNLFDMPRDERGPLRDWSLAILGALEPVLTPERADAGHAAVTGFSDYLDDLIARRKRRPGDPETDVLTRLIAGDGAARLDHTELVQNCIFILNAGHETTTNLIGNALALMIDHPAERQRLIEEPALIDTAVEEVLRVESPNQLGNRLTTAVTQFHGTELPANTRLHLCIGAANRDPRVFPDPERVDFARRPNRHLAFAGGPHVCLGLTLARMEGRIAIARFLARFPDYATAGPRLRTGRVRFRGLSALPVTLRPDCA